LTPPGQADKVHTIFEAIGGALVRRAFMQGVWTRCPVASKKRNNKGVLMKKLMMFAAAMTIAGGAFADACGIPETSSSCTYGVWDLSLSGKTTQDDAKKGYIKTASQKLTGLLVAKNQPLYVGDGTFTTNYTDQVVSNDLGGGIWDVVTNQVVDTIVENTVESGDCCVEAFDVFLTGKGWTEIWYFEDQPIRKLSVFGAGLDKVLKSSGKAKSTAVETDVAWTLGGDLGDAVALQFVGWGKGKKYFLDGTIVTQNGACEIDDKTEICAEWFEPGNWSGYFTGTFGELAGEEVYPWSCDIDITCVPLYGGTWSAKWNKKLSGVFYEDFDSIKSSLYSKLNKNADLVEAEF
jgi:hypothetical protein